MFIGLRSVLLSGCVIVSACGDQDRAETEQADATSAPVATASTAPASSADGGARAAGVEQFLLQTYPGAEHIDYALAWRDLNADGSDEAIVYLAGRDFCGTGGCSLLVLSKDGEGWRTVGDVSTTRTPVSVLASSSNGWRDLAVVVAGGGGPAGTMTLEFDGKAYPGNASIAEPTDAAGQMLLPEKPEMRSARPASGPA